MVFSLGDLMMECLLRNLPTLDSYKRYTSFCLRRIVSIR
jgi:hypothetical protein